MRPKPSTCASRWARFDAACAAAERLGYVVTVCPTLGDWRFRIERWLPCERDYLTQLQLNDSQQITDLDKSRAPRLPDQEAVAASAGMLAEACVVRVYQRENMPLWFTW